MQYSTVGPIYYYTNSSTTGARSSFSVEFSLQGKQNHRLLVTLLHRVRKPLEANTGIGERKESDSTQRGANNITLL